MQYYFSKLLRLKKVLTGQDFYFDRQVKINIITLGNKHAQFTIAPDYVKANAIVYSFGVGTDISFDLEMIKRVETKIFAFDPTPKSKAWLQQQNIPESFQFSPYGLSDKNGIEEFFIPENQDHVSFSTIKNSATKSSTIELEMKTLDQLMMENNHREIDILKMDIEGSEYKVIKDIVLKKIPIKQILVEFHHRFNNVGIQETKNAIKLLNANGYAVFSVSNNGEEYSFIKK